MVKHLPLCCGAALRNAFTVLPQVEKEREALRFEMNKAAAQMKEADAAIAAQKAELDKLNQIITEADQVTLYIILLALPWLQIVW